MKFKGILLPCTTHLINVVCTDKIQIESYRLMMTPWALRFEQQKISILAFCQFGFLSL